METFDCRSKLATKKKWSGMEMCCGNKFDAESKYEL